MYKLGDTGLIVEFINSRLGVSSKKFTEETRTRLKQYQAAYRQNITDDTMKEFQNYLSSYTTLNNFNYDPYNQIYYKLEDPPYKDLNHNVANEPEYEIYPNGICDSWTLHALTEIDIDVYEDHILEQVQKALSSTEYSDFQHIEPIAIYDEKTHEAIRKFQIAHNVGQQKFPIYQNKNILSNNKQEWNKSTYLYTTSVQNYQYRPDEYYAYNELTLPENAELRLPVSDDKTLLSPFIALERGAIYYIKIHNSNEYYIKIQFFKSPDSTSGNRILQLSNNAEPLASSSTSSTNTGFNDWFDISYTTVNSPDAGNKLYEGAIYPNYYSPQDTGINYIIFYIRVMLRRIDGADISLDELDDLQIQLEKGTEPTFYEPNSQTVSNSFQSGYINIPTYNKIKQVFNLKEADY